MTLPAATLCTHTHMTERSFCLQAVNHLRYECIPVAITEGRSPAEKLERLQQRCGTLPWVACLRDIVHPVCQGCCLYLSIDIKLSSDDVGKSRFKARTGQSGGGTGNQYFARMGTAVANMLHSLVGSQLTTTTKHCQNAQTDAPSLLFPLHAVFNMHVKQ